MFLEKDGKMRMINSSERELIIKAKKGNMYAVKKLYGGCEKYIRKLALAYEKNNSYLTVEDFMQDGFIGIMNAVYGYNLNYDVNFLTYASYHIKNEMIKDIRNSGKLCRMPNYIYERKRDSWIKYGKALSIFEENDIENIAKFMNVEKEELENIKKSYYRCGFSLNEKTGEGEIIDYLIDNTKNTEEEVERNLFNERIRQIVDCLENERHKMVIIQRYGLNGEEPKTHKQIGKLLGVTKERVRQIEGKTLRMLKAQLVENELLECDNEVDETDNFYQSEKNIYDTICKNNEGKCLIYKK